MLLPRCSSLASPWICATRLTSLARASTAGVRHRSSTPLFGRQIETMTQDFLSEILAQKREATARMREHQSAGDLCARALDIRKNAEPHRLLRSLNSTSPRTKIIAEFKRKSPSVGMIRNDLSAGDVARHYEGGGACAISVL